MDNKLPGPTYIYCLSPLMTSATFFIRSPLFTCTCLIFYLQSNYDICLSLSVHNANFLQQHAQPVTMNPSPQQMPLSADTHLMDPVLFPLPVFLCLAGDFQPTVVPPPVFLSPSFYSVSLFAIL